MTSWHKDPFENIYAVGEGNSVSMMFRFCGLVWRGGRTAPLQECPACSLRFDALQCHPCLCAGSPPPPTQVVAGSKTFTLLPPADIFRMRLRQYASATYVPQGGEAASQVGRAAHTDAHGAVSQACCSGLAAASLGNAGNIAHVPA